jgi:hypothetical protein
MATDRALTPDDRKWINDNLTLAEPSPPRNRIRVYPSCGHQIGGPHETFQIRDCNVCNHYLIFNELI